MAKKRIVSTVSAEERRQKLINSGIKDMKIGIELGSIPKNPTRHFNVDERVHWGHLNEIYIHEIGEDSLYYVCKAIGVKREKNAAAEDEFHVVPWFEVYPYMQSKDTKFTVDERYYIRQLNSGIDSLLHIVYASYGGVDFDVEYQREHVWGLDDKVALIDSIFNNIDIGKFIFVQLHQDTMGRYYQVIDGKQRLTALCEFYEDRFQYRGYYFSELSFRDKQKFKSHGISYGFLENPDKRGIYETFIKMNTCGKPMDAKHIDKVKKLLSEL